MKHNNATEGTIGLINLYHYEIRRSQEIKDNYEGGHYENDYNRS